MENDIQSIHNIISNCNIEGSLDELNEKLADQLEGLLNQRCTSTQNEHQIAINPENSSCFKCKNTAQGVLTVPQESTGSTTDAKS